MKKKLAVVLSALLAASVLAGCGKEADTNPGETTETVIQTTESAETGMQTTEDSGVQDTDAVESVYLRDVDVAQYLTLTSDYKGLPLMVSPKAEVTAESVASLALNAYNSSVTAENGGIIDRAVAVGDTINLDYAGKEDGVAFDGGTAAGQSLEIGSGSFIPGFEDGLVGVMPGETLDLDLIFPQDYFNADMAGKAVVFTVTVNFIYPSSREEMKDEIISAITAGEYATVDAFIDYCQEYLEYNADYEYQAAKENAVIAALEEIAEFESVPEGLVAKYAGNIQMSLDSQAAQYGVDADTFCLYFYQMDSASYIEQASEASARQAMVFQYIANEENLNVSDEELDESLQSFVEENGLGTVEELLASADKEEFREYFMFEKVADFVFENAQVAEN
ncbi:MAG: trigger factor [Lachnospiraceae bacterium]